MKYTKEERLDIGKRVYNRELTVDAAAVQYDLNPTTVKGYLRLYREMNGLQPRMGRPPYAGEPAPEAVNLEGIKAMSREELIDALVMARITEARLKKGYEVKGDGTVIRYGKKNTK